MQDLPDGEDDDPDDEGQRDQKVDEQQVGALQERRRRVEGHVQEGRGGVAGQRRHHPDDLALGAETDRQPDAGHRREQRVAEEGHHAAQHEQALQRLERWHLAEGPRGVPVGASVVEDVLDEGEGSAGQTGEHDAAHPADPLVAHQDRQPEQHGALGELLDPGRDEDRRAGPGGRIAVADDGQLRGRPGVHLRGEVRRHAGAPTEGHQPDPEPLRPITVGPQEQQ